MSDRSERPGGFVNQQPNAVWHQYVHRSFSHDLELRYIVPVLTTPPPPLATSTLPLAKPPCLLSTEYRSILPLVQVQTLSRSLHRQLLQRRTRRPKANSLVELKLLSAKLRRRAIVESAVVV